VARASSCRALLSTAFDFATIFGHPADLDAVELLFTSLLVQATGGVATARPPGRDAPSAQVAAYRRSWLLAYAQRVGERLDEASRSAVAEVEAERGSMALVLAARTEAVDEAVREAAPDARTLRARASSAAGWAAGRAAGDRATLDHRTPLPTEQPALGWHDPGP
jgi:hypothetical protein